MKIQGIGKKKSNMYKRAKFGINFYNFITEIYIIHYIVYTLYSAIDRGTGQDPRRNSIFDILP